MPTLSDLIDRLSITIQKTIFIPERRAEYEQETADLMHDIDLLLAEQRDKGHVIGAELVHLTQVVMLANRYVWENEAWARAAMFDESIPLEVRYKRLVGTHSINGVRNTAKNKISALFGGRRDYKIDCFAAELIDVLGNWNIFDQEAPDDGNGHGNEATAR